MKFLRNRDLPTQYLLRTEAKEKVAKMRRRMSDQPNNLPKGWSVTHGGLDVDELRRVLKALSELAESATNSEIKADLNIAHRSISELAVWNEEPPEEFAA